MKELAIKVLAAQDAQEAQGLGDFGEGARTDWDMVKMQVLVDGVRAKVTSVFRQLQCFPLWWSWCEFYSICVRTLAHWFMAHVRLRASTSTRHVRGYTHSLYTDTQRHTHCFCSSLPPSLPPFPPSLSPPHCS